MPDIDPNLVHRYWQKKVFKELMAEWQLLRDNYLCPDTRSRWRKAYDWCHWRTIGRFKMWLHRDCGDW